MDTQEFALIEKIDNKLDAFTREFVEFAATQKEICKTQCLRNGILWDDLRGDGKTGLLERVKVIEQDAARHKDLDAERRRTLMWVGGLILTNIGTVGTVILRWLNS